MEKKTFEQLREQRFAANEKLGDIYIKASNRELTAEEQMNVTNLSREIEMCERQMKGIKMDADYNNTMRENAMVNKNKAFREIMNDNTVWMAKIPVKIYIGEHNESPL